MQLVLKDSLWDMGKDALPHCPNSIPIYDFPGATGAPWTWFLRVGVIPSTQQM